MGERITILIATVATVIMLPYILTLSINGRQKDAVSQIEQIDTGRDVLLQVEGGNYLLDVEQYIAGVLPGLVDSESGAAMIEAQAVAVRTKIYYAMGDNTIIDARNLEFQYYMDQDYIDKWGQAKYLSVKRKYEQAVLNTSGKIIE